MLDPDAVVRSLDDLVGADRLGFTDLLGEVVAADQALGRGDRVGRIVDDVRPGRVADGDRTVFVRTRRRWRWCSRRRRSRAPRRSPFRMIADAGVAGSQIDSQLRVQPQAAPYLSNRRARRPSLCGDPPHPSRHLVRIRGLHPMGVQVVALRYLPVGNLSERFREDVIPCDNRRYRAFQPRRMLECRQSRVPPARLPGLDHRFTAALGELGRTRRQD